MPAVPGTCCAQDQWGSRAAPKRCLACRQPPRPKLLQAWQRVTFRVGFQWCRVDLKRCLPLAEESSQTQRNRPVLRRPPSGDDLHKSTEASKVYATERLLWQWLGHRVIDQLVIGSQPDEEFAAPCQVLISRLGMKSAQRRTKKATTAMSRHSHSARPTCFQARPDQYQREETSPVRVGLI